MTHHTDLCKCSHERGLHLPRTGLCMATRCRCKQFIPKQDPFVVPPPRQTLELHQEPTKKKETQK